jgi:hypothetical protein|tara:strand:- start:9961 stop:10065 length:105 start_codon:yes stop_codon:yes gene_type:complete
METFVSEKVATVARSTTSTNALGTVKEKISASFK